MNKLVFRSDKAIKTQNSESGRSMLCGNLLVTRFATCYQSSMPSEVAIQPLGCMGLAKDYHSERQC